MVMHIGSGFEAGGAAGRQFLEPVEFDVPPPAPSPSPAPSPPAAPTLQSLPNAAFGPPSPYPGDAPRPSVLADLPSPPAMAVTQIAVAAAAPAPAVPTATPLEIATLELTLADPLNRELVNAHGGALAILPTQGNDPVTQGQVDRYGADLTARLMQLAQANAAVRNLYAQCMDEAAQHLGPGVAGAVFVPGEQGGTDSQDPIADSWRFDPVLFTQAYAQGSSLAQRAFAAQYGPDALQAWESRDPTDAGMDTHGHTLAGQFELTAPAHTDLDGHPNRERMGWTPASLNPDGNELRPITLSSAPELHNAQAVWFDATLGWVTPRENVVVRASFLDKVAPMAFIAVATWATAGAFGIAGGAGVASGAGIGAGTGLTAAMTVGASFGAIGGFYSGLINNGRVDLKDIFRGALTGAVTAGFAEATGLNSIGLDHTNNAAGQPVLTGINYAERALAVTGQATLQGALTEIAGGDFKDGFTAALAQGLGAEVARGLNLQIAELQSGTNAIDAAQAGALRQFARVAQSAVSLLARPDDPGFAFAQTFVNGLVGDVQQGLNERTEGEAVSHLWASVPDQTDAETARLARQGSSQVTQAGGAEPGQPTVNLVPPVLRIEVNGHALPRDALGNRYELTPAGYVVVHQADGQLLRIDARQVQESGLSAELTTMAALVLNGGSNAGAGAGTLISRGLPLLAAAAPWVPLAAATGLLAGDTPQPLVIRLGPGLNFFQRAGELVGQLQRYDPTTGLWELQAAQGWEDGAGQFRVQLLDEVDRFPEPMITPLQPELPQRTPPFLAADGRPESLPGRDRTGISDEPAVPGRSVDTPDWRDSILTRDEMEQRRFRGRVIGEMFAGDPLFRPSDYEAHHILPLSEYPDLQELRDRFVNDWHIDLNDLANGVALPKNAGVGEGTPHRDTQGNRNYERALLERFQNVRTRDQALERLADIKQELRDGTFVQPKTRNP